MIEKEIGEKIRQLRKQRGITLDSLTMRTGLSTGYLSKIERGLSSPPIATLSRIAAALGVKPSDFFEVHEKSDRLSIVAPDERKPLSRQGLPFGYYYESIAYKKHGKLIEPYIITLTPDCSDKRMFSHNGEEMQFLLEGSIKLTYDEEEYFIDQVGTCIYFDSSAPHRADADGGREAKLLVVVCQPQLTGVEPAPDSAD